MRPHVLLVAVVAFFVAGAASALVLGEKSEEKKLRADIGKQLTKLADCYGKAWMKCEKKTDPFTTSCSLVTGQSNLDPMSPGDLAGKFSADIAKCESKVNFLKKAKTLNSTTGYQAIGCVGDSDPNTVGEQPFADLAGYQGGSAVALRTAVDQFGLISAVSGCVGDPKEDKCVETLVKTLAGFTKSIGICTWKCENDFKDKKGNGGPNDDDNCSVLQYATTTPTPDANMTVCEDKAWSKVDKKYPGGLPALVDSLVMPAVVDQLNGANDSYYNVVGGNCP
jgi:hypothetical protein